jgi:hypothetical protein
MNQKVSKKHSELRRKANRERTLAISTDRGEVYKNIHNTQAECLEKEADDLIRVDTPREVGPGGELTPAKGEVSSGKDSELGGRDTLKEPSQINQEASIKRLDYLADAGIYETALDVAESIEPRNSQERMLAHQMALAHDQAFKLSSMAMSQNDPIEIVRLANASGRQMDVYQKALLALHKIRTGGKQHVTVQHVTVKDGGQAVVTGKMKGGLNGGGSEEDVE